MESEHPQRTTSATLFFTVKDDPIHERERPYVHSYIPKGIPRTNLTYRSVENITLRDLRTRPLNYKDHGLTVTPFSTALSYEDFKDPAKIESSYFGEAQSTLREVLAAKEVRIFGYQVRRRPPSFPFVGSSDVDCASVPILGAHCDYTEAGSKHLIRLEFGDKAESMLRRPHQLVNLWRPLRGPVHDCPLALCDPRTVDTSQDVMHLDEVHERHITELWNLHYNPRQEWYYLSDQEPTEALVFKEYDSVARTMPGVAHCAFVKDTHVSRDQARESIEVRAMAFFGD